jgi:predicted nuclease with TOPRIM domain
MASNQQADQENLEEKLKETVKHNIEIEKTIQQLAYEIHVVKKTFQMVTEDVENNQLNKQGSKK